MSSDFPRKVEDVRGVDKIINTLKIHLVEVEMMRDRGYDVGDVGRSVLEIYRNTSNELSSVLAIKAHIDILANIAVQRNIPVSTVQLIHAMDSVYVHPKTGQVTAVVHVPNPSNKNISIEDVRRMTADVNPETSENRFLLNHDGTRMRPTNAIFVLETKMTPSANNLLEAFRAIPYQVFLFEEMFYNPTKHALCPHYEHVREHDRIQKLIGRNKLTELPHILEKDPISKYYGARPGDVMIERSDTSLFPQMVTNHVTLRVVVPSV